MTREKSNDGLIDTNKERLMDVWHALERRRAIKEFDPDVIIPPEDIDRILQGVALTPTAFNLWHVRFLLVRDDAIRQRLRQAAWGQAQVTEAAELIVVCADLKCWEDPQHIKDNGLRAMIRRFYEGQETLQRDEAVRSAAMAAQTLMLCAAALDYDTCPMDGYDPQKVHAILDLPEAWIVVMFVALGRRRCEPPPRPPRPDQEQWVGCISKERTKVREGGEDR